MMNREEREKIFEIMYGMISGQTMWKSSGQKKGKRCARSKCQLLWKMENVLETWGRGYLVRLIIFEPEPNGIKKLP